MACNSKTPSPALLQTGASASAFALAPKYVTLPHPTEPAVQFGSISAHWKLFVVLI